MNRYLEVTGTTPNGRRIVFFRADEKRTNRVNSFLKEHSIGTLPFDLLKVEKVCIVSGLPLKTGKVFEGVGYAY